MEVLGLDIGGTNTRIALIKILNKKPVIVNKVVHPTKNVKNLSTVINNFPHKAKSACIGFAGPITGNNGKLTNAKLTVNINKLKKETMLSNIILLNDFHANGYAIPFLEKKDLIVINKGITFNTVSMILGPGTGLGKAFLIGKTVYPAEGGLTSIGVEDSDDIELFKFLKKKYKVVYYEDVLSGRGIIDLYRFHEIKLKIKNNDISNQISSGFGKCAELITKYSSSDKVSFETVKFFIKYFARFVRNSALSLISSNIYMVGGIPTAMKQHIKQNFRKEFLKHRKYTPLLKNMNVYIVETEDVGLLGSGVVAAKLK